MHFKTKYPQYGDYLLLYYRMLDHPKLWKMVLNWSVFASLCLNICALYLHLMSPSKKKKIRSIVSHRLKQHYCQATSL